jgi:hypothetical protein
MQTDLHMQDVRLNFYLIQAVSAIRQKQTTKMFRNNFTTLRNIKFKLIEKGDETKKIFLCSTVTQTWSTGAHDFVRVAGMKNIQLQLCNSTPLIRDVPSINFVLLTLPHGLTPLFGQANLK